MGTTHADYFRGDVPVTRPLGADEVADAYERNTGLVIVETFRELGLAPTRCPACWWRITGRSPGAPIPFAAVERARVLEMLARMDVIQRAVAPDAPRPRRS